MYKEKTLIENVKVIGKLTHSPRNLIIQEVDNPTNLWSIEPERVNGWIGCLGKIVYCATSNEGFYKFERD